MKRINLAVVIGALLLLLTAAAHPQVTGAKIFRIDIPFDFALGDTKFQAGRYEVSVAWEGVIWVRGADAHGRAVTSQSVRTGKSAEQTKLVFRHFGGQYFLAQVWVRGDGAGRELRPSRGEKEMMSQVKPDAVEVLARK